MVTPLELVHELSVMLSLQRLCYGKPFFYAAFVLRVRHCAVAYCNHVSVIVVGVRAQMTRRPTVHMLRSAVGHLEAVHLLELLTHT